MRTSAHPPAEARSRIARHTPEEAQRADALLVDLRSHDERRRDDGYSSSLAAASLVELGFERAGDLEGGFAAWRAAGLPVVEAPPHGDELPGMGGPQ